MSSAWCTVEVVTTGRCLLLDRKHLLIYEYLDSDHKVPWAMRGLPLSMTLWVMSYEFLPEKLFEMIKHLSCSWLALSFALSPHLQEVHLIFQPCIMTWLVCIGGAQEGKRRGGKKVKRPPSPTPPWGDTLPCQHFISATSLTTTSEKLFPIWRHLPFWELFLSLLPPLDPPLSRCCICFFTSTHWRYLSEFSLCFAVVPTLVNSSLMLSVVPASL